MITCLAVCAAMREKYSVTAGIRISSSSFAPDLIFFAPASSISTLSLVTWATTFLMRKASTWAVSGSILASKFTIFPECFLYAETTACSIIRRISSFLMPLSRSICSRTGINSLFSATPSSCSRRHSRFRGGDDLNLNLDLRVQFRLGDPGQRQRKHLLCDIFDLHRSLGDPFDRSSVVPAAIDRRVQINIHPLPFNRSKSFSFRRGR